MINPLALCMYLDFLYQPSFPLLSSTTSRTADLISGAVGAESAAATSGRQAARVKSAGNRTAGAIYRSRRETLRGKRQDGRARACLLFLHSSTHQFVFVAQLMCVQQTRAATRRLTSVGDTCRWFNAAATPNDGELE